MLSTLLKTHLQPKAFFIYLAAPYTRMTIQDPLKKNYEQGKGTAPSITEKAKQTISSLTETAKEATERVVHTAQSSLESIMGKAEEAKKEISTSAQTTGIKSAQQEQDEAVQIGKTSVSFDPSYSSPKFTSSIEEEASYSKSAPETTAAGSGGITGVISGMAHKVSETMSSAAEKVGSMVGLGSSHEVPSDIPSHAQMEAARLQGMTDQAGLEARKSMQAASDKGAELAQDAQRKGVGVSEGITGATRTGQSKASEAAEAVKEKLSEISQSAKQTASQLGQGAKDRAQSSYDRVASLSQDAKETASNLAQDVKNKTSDVLEKTKESIGMASEKASQKAVEAKDMAAEKGHDARVVTGTKVENVGKTIKGTSQ